MEKNIYKIPVKEAKVLNRHFTEEDNWMTDKHMKKCSTSLDIGEIQIKTIMRHHYSIIRICKIKTNPKQTQCQVPAKTQSNWNPLYCWWRCKMVWPILGNILTVSYKVKHTHDSVIPFLGIYPSEMKTYGHTKL